LHKFTKDEINIPYSQLAIRINVIPPKQRVIIISKKGTIAAQIPSLLNACGYRTWTLFYTITFPNSFKLIPKIILLLIRPGKQNGKNITGNPY